MTDNVFTLAAAGDYFNRHFVNIKIDMEKGEGPALKDKYDVTAFPTFLILDADGREIHRVVGGGGLEDFIARVDVGINAEKSVEQFGQEYESGTISKRDLITYWQILRARGSVSREKTAEVAGALYTKLSRQEKLSADYWPVVQNAAADDVMGEGMTFVLDNRRELEREHGESVVDRLIEGAFGTANIRALDPRRPVDVQLVRDLIARLEPIELRNKTRLMSPLLLADAYAAGDAEKYVALLGESYRQTQDHEVLRALVRADALAEGSDGTKALYVHMNEMATEVAERARVEMNGLGASNLAAQYKRKSTVGICWDEFETFEAALAQAMREQRRLFVYGYTQSCGPCKYMSDNVFTLEEVGDYLNSRFINIKMDMQTDEGRKIAEAHGIRTVPTFLIFEPNGALFDMLRGTSPNGAAFVSRLEDALQKPME